MEEKDGSLRLLIEELRRAPDGMVLPFLSALRNRRGDIATVLDGRSLRVEVVIVGERRHTYRLVFTAAGHVELAGSYGFDPHIRFEGTPDRLFGVLLGTLDTFSAVYDQVLTLYFPPDELVHYPRIRRLLATQVEVCPSR
ncbi:MAG TPA: hypothetical protein VM938_07830 [Acidimicrobiales bacterium]|nr:hypothetical protein [Acidimicrobiales bacterium]